MYLLIDIAINDIRPRYLEALEESLNDTANLLASIVESESNANEIETNLMQKAFVLHKNKKLKAKIYQVTKTRADIEITITNKAGIVIFDSTGKSLGQDFSKWNDVYLTLKGKYGARSTRTIKDDPSTSSMYIAAPITKNKKIIGVLTVIKKKDSISPFINFAKQKVIVSGIVIAVFLILLTIIITIWITHPIYKFKNHVEKLILNSGLKTPHFNSPEIKSLNSAFMKLIKELEGKKYIENYIQSLTHELKSPLTAITGAIEILEDENIEKKRQIQFKKIISIETNRMHELIQKLLELATLENKHELQNIEKINIEQLIQEILSSFTAIIVKKELVINILNPNNININAEKFLIKVALLNILKNAFEFSDNKTIVQIEITKNETTNICIENTGVLIPNFALHRVFERFYSLPRPTTQIKSTGLGLAFVKQTIELHGGSIILKNNENPGVTCIIKLPF